MVKKGDLEAARKLAEEVWGIKKHWQTAAYLAFVECKANRYRNAAEHAAWSLRHYAKDQPDERKITENVYQLATAQVATIHLKGVGQDATVFVDGQPRDRLFLPDPVFVDPGPHTVEVRRADGATKKQTVAAEAGKTMELDVTPGPVAKPVAAATASAPPATSTPPPTAFETSSRGWSPRTWTLVAEGGLAAVAVGVGVGFGLRANSLRDDVQSASAALGPSNSCATRSPQCVDFSAAADDHDTAARWANIGLIAGGVLGVATVATFLLWPKSRANGTSGIRYSITPMAGSSTGLTLHSSF